MEKSFQIITFYEFKPMERLDDVRADLRELMARLGIKGTIILADEGFNSTVAGTPAAIREFVPTAENILQTTLKFKSSYHSAAPFRRIHVKIKPEIVALKKPVNIALGSGTHVGPAEWNRLIADPEVFVLDTRNDYEYRNGTFHRAINPETEKFSELPEFIKKHLDPERHTKVAMFCTGGIRCEKFAPFMKGLGFEEVYQLEGGILKYLESVPAEENLWQGECFIFDDRTTLDTGLKKGSGPDHSVNKNKGRADKQ